MSGTFRVVVVVAAVAAAVIRALVTHQTLSSASSHAR